jgi:hypothetical protein
MYSRQSLETIEDQSLAAYGFRSRIIIKGVLRRTPNRFTELLFNATAFSILRPSEGWSIKLRSSLISKVIISTQGLHTRLK